jgi:hypothetical protein
VKKKGKMGYFGNKWRNWGPPRGPEITPNVSITFPILFPEKTYFISLLRAH